ncbi:MAG: hypothetical protein JSS49_15970 [Planctomycetes bacterium]|nr:hypothetical protein [Planctomycetota bacterium]
MSERTEKPIAGLVVFEREPVWGPELKRQYSNQPILVRECRSVQDLVAIPEVAETVFVLTLDAAPQDCLSWLVGWCQRRPRSPVVVISSAKLADLEWPIREAGAAAFVSDELAGHHVASLCRRLLRTGASAVPVAGLSGQ